MAEKFVKPKAFTGEWWGYIYDYYRYNIIIIAMISLFVIILGYHILNPEKYDLKLTFASDVYVSDEQIEGLKKSIGDIVGDIDNNGKVNIFVSDYYLPANDSSQEAGYQLALRQKLAIDMFEDENIIYIFNEETALQYLSQAEEGFYPSVKWSNKDNADNLIYNNSSYGVSLGNSKLLSDLKIDAGKLYVLIKTPEIVGEKFKDRIPAVIDLANKLSN